MNLFDLITEVTGQKFCECCGQPSEPPLCSKKCIEWFCLTIY